MSLRLHKYNCVDFGKVDSIGVLCRGKSLGSIGKYKKNFQNIFVIGQHYKSFKMIGEHILGSNIVKVWGKTFNKPSRGYMKQYVKWDIKDMQTTLDPEISDRKKYKFKKITQRHEQFMTVYSVPLNICDRNKRFIKKRKHHDNGKINHPTLGLFGVDLACAYKPKTVNIIGLDFYCAPDFVEEKKHVSTAKNFLRSKMMMEYFVLLCQEEPDIKFNLYICCNKIKSSGNLKVIRV